MAQGLSQGYGRRVVFEDISIELEPGTTALLGPNGAGKSTLMRTLATVQPHRDGKLVIAGQAVGSEKEARMARRSIGYLPQNFGCDPLMSVQDFVLYGAWMRGLTGDDQILETREAIARVGLADRSRDRIKNLSGGMRQRLGIAWAIVGRPPVVLLDEPTVGLDPEQRIHFRAILGELDGVSVLLSTHLTDDVDAACDRVFVMDQGRIVFSGLKTEMKAMDAGGPGVTSMERAYMNLLALGAGSA